MVKRDFIKPKRKLGKKLKPQNETNINFRSRKIFSKTTSNDSEDQNMFTKTLEKSDFLNQIFISLKSEKEFVRKRIFLYYYYIIKFIYIYYYIINYYYYYYRLLLHYYLLLQLLLHYCL